jgi:hypothetical protein
MAEEAEFDRLMPIMHRRMAFAVSAPALVRHVAFRFRKNHDPSLAANTGGTATRFDKIYDLINTQLEVLQKKYGVADVETFNAWNRDDSILKQLNKLPKSLLGWRARVLIDVYAEYFSITLIFDQNVINKGPAEASNLASRLKKAIHSDAQAVKLIKQVYEDVWEKWFIPDSVTTSSNWPGEKFVEARGLILSTKSRLRRTSSGRKGFIALADVAENHIDNDLVLKQANNLGPLLSRVLRPSTDAKDESVGTAANCVLCETLGGDAIYGSSLPHSIPEPLRYFVLHNSRSEDQLGRYLRQVHVLGELRFAALLDYKELKEADQKIRELGNKIDTALAERDEKRKLANKKLSHSPREDFDLDEVQREFNKISSSNIRGGLVYRINWSRNYANAFRARVPLIQIKSLRGWDSYKDFVGRNLYYFFDHIDRIGIRYDALSQRVQRLTAASTMDSMHDLVGEMNRADTSIYHIQVIGEVIGIAAFTYYGGHILEIVLDRHMPACPASPEAKQALSEQPQNKTHHCIMSIPILEFTVNIALVFATLLAIAGHFIWPHRRATSASSQKFPAQ